jgi:hypothetical protein
MTPHESLLSIIPPGTKTDFGVVQAIHSKNGERSYLCIDEHGTVTVVPEELIGEVAI